MSVARASTATWLHALRDPQRLVPGFTVHAHKTGVEKSTANIPDLVTELAMPMCGNDAHAQARLVEAVTRLKEKPMWKMSVLAGNCARERYSTIRFHIAGLRNTALAFSVKILPCKTRRKMKMRVS